MNALLHHVKRAERALRSSCNFIAIADLRLSRLKRLPTSLQRS